MVRISRTFVVALMLGALVAGLSGCKKKGPAERAGEQIDKAAEKTGEQMEKAGDKVKDAVKDLKK